MFQDGKPNRRAVKPCKPCAAARKFMPRKLRERLEKMEQEWRNKSKGSASS